MAEIALEVARKVGGGLRETDGGILTVVLD